MKDTGKVIAYGTSSFIERVFHSLLVVEPTSFNVIDRSLLPMDTGLDTRTTIRRSEMLIGVNLGLVSRTFFNVSILNETDSLWFLAWPVAAFVLTWQLL